MKNITKKKLAVILESHEKRVNHIPDGVRANLREAHLYGANLREADLYGANLREADLREADLREADLREAHLYRANLREADLYGADLYGADLYGAHLYGANLREADLREADLYGADLYGADLYGANLYGANLREAHLYGANLKEANLYGADLSEAHLYGANLSGAKLNWPIACPEKGSFIAFKKASGYIVELLVTEDALRSSATSRKCRCSKAKVISITNFDGADSGLHSVSSSRDKDFIYTVGETVEAPEFDQNRWNECASGIHFFITRQEAITY